MNSKPPPVTEEFIFNLPLTTRFQKTFWVETGCSKN